MIQRSIFVVLTLALTAWCGHGYALGSLKSVGSVWKKTGYDCVVRSFAEDRAGRLWAGTFGAGLFVFDGNVWEQIASIPEAIPDGRISKLVIDADGSLLAATAGGGAFRFDAARRSSSPLIPGNEPGSRHFHAFIRTNDGRFLLGAVGEGVFLAEKGDWKHLTESDGLPSSWVNDAVPDGDGGIWLATWDGIARLDRAGSIDRVELPESPWTDGNVNALASCAGTLWIGTGSGGLIRRNPPALPRKRPQYVRIPDVAPQVHALQEHDGSLWAATEQGLFRVDPATGRAVPDCREAGEAAFTALGVWKSALVAGTDMGAIWLRENDGRWSKIFEYRKDKPQTGGRSR